MKQRTLPLLTAGIMFVTMSPFFVWPLFQSIPFLGFFLKVVIAYIFYSQRSFPELRKSKNAATIFTAATAISVILSVIHGDASFFGVLSFALNFVLLSLFFSSVEFASKTYTYFVYIFVFFLSLSFIAWVFYLLGRAPVLGEITSSDADREYIVYPFLVVEPKATSLFRFCGVFDEPGVVGTLCGIFLCINKFDFHKKINILITVFGLASLSLFFIIILFGAFFFHLFFVRRNYKAVLLFIGALFLLYTHTKDDPILSESIWQRLEWDSSTKQIAGNDRTSEEADRFYNTNVKGTLAFYFGMGYSEEYERLSQGSCSYKNSIVFYGAIFLFLYVFSFLVLAYKYKKNTWTFLLHSAVILGMTYQRPSIYGVPIIFLYIVLAKECVMYSNATQTKDLKRL